MHLFSLVQRSARKFRYSLSSCSIYTPHCRNIFSNNKTIHRITKENNNKTQNKTKPQQKSHKQRRKMSIPDVFCGNLPCDPYSANPARHAAQRLLDAFDVFERQHPQVQLGELISVDISANTNPYAIRTCAFLRFANAAVHREAVCQMQGKVYVDHHALRFDMAHSDPKPLNRDTTWCLDRYRRSQPPTNAGTSAQLVNHSAATHSTQLLNSEPTSSAAQRPSTATRPIPVATEPSSSSAIATSAGDFTIRARSATPTRPVSSKLPPICSRSTPSRQRTSPCRQLSPPHQQQTSRRR